MRCAPRAESPPRGLPQLFQLDQPAARATLNALVESGLLESRGEGKGRTYHMSAALYRQLGKPAQYVRTKGV